MKNLFGSFLGLFLSITFSASVLAAPPFYVGGGIGQSYVEENNVFAGDDFDDEDFGFKVFGGYNFHKNFAAEIDYLNFGEPSDDIFGVDIKIEDFYAIALYGVGKLPLSEHFELFAKLGAAYWEGDAKARFMGISASSREDGTEFAYGLGASYAFTDQYAVRVEYEEIDTDSDDLSTLGLLTVGGEVRF
ncbi:MAG: outer membrane beta-barrel protein [Gammaproteobacteria bacterium]